MGETEIGAALKACRGCFLAVFAFSLAINLLALASPLYMMQLYDRVLSSRSTETLIMLTIIVSVALGAMALVESARREVLSRVGIWLDDRLGPAVLAGGLRASLAGDPTRAGQSLRDLETLRGFLAGPAIGPLMDAPWTPIFLIALFVLHPLLGALGSVGAATLFGLALLNEATTRRRFEEAQAAQLRAQHRAQAALRNAEAIQALGMTAGVVRQWRRDGAIASRTQQAAGRVGTLILGFSRFSRLTIQTLIMGAGAFLAIRHEVNPGAIFAASFLLSRALAPVEAAIATWRSLIGARLAHRRLAELLPVVQEPAPMTLPRPTGRLSVESVFHAPPGAEGPVLRGVSFSVEPGEMLGVIGPSAAGKSTLARLIAGVTAPSAGRIRLDGGDVTLWLAAGGARDLGYLPQDVELLDGTIAENICRLGEPEPDAVVAAAKEAGLHEMIMGLPKGYDSPVGEGGVRLSGGQRQRIGLARALFGEPRLLVLDEPNASLDHEGEAALQQALARLKARGSTVLVIAHRASILALADRVLFLRQGRVEAFGPKAEVIQRLAPQPVAVQAVAVQPTPAQSTPAQSTPAQSTPAQSTTPAPVVHSGAVA